MAQIMGQTTICHQRMTHDSGYLGFQKLLILLSSYLFFKKYLLFIWLCQVLVWQVGSSLCRVGSFVAADGLSSCACGLQSVRASVVAVMGLAALWHVGSKFPDQGSNLRPLHCKENSEPLDHQGSPFQVIFFKHNSSHLCST